MQIRNTQEIAGTARYQRMIRSMGMVLVAALLLTQLMFFPMHSSILAHFGNDRPWMKLPVASNPVRSCVCFFGDELSWTEAGGWVGGSGAIKRDEMDAFLRDRVKRAEGLGRRFSLRLRIPAEAEAGHFTAAAISAQRAGVWHLHVAVIKPQTARSSAAAGR